MQSPSQTFRALHEADGAFIIPNPWDIGSARILADMGFKALATTSAGMAHSLGVPDGKVSRQATLAHCRDIVSATTLPVSADLEKGFGDSPELRGHHVARRAVVHPEVDHHGLRSLLNRRVDMPFCNTFDVHSVLCD